MQTKEITYFSLSVDRAEKRYADYKARTETQEIGRASCRERV